MQAKYRFSSRVQRKSLSFQTRRFEITDPGNFSVHFSGRAQSEDGQSSPAVVDSGESRSAKAGRPRLLRPAIFYRNGRRHFALPVGTLTPLNRLYSIALKVSHPSSVPASPLSTVYATPAPKLQIHLVALGLLLHPA